MCNKSVVMVGHDGTSSEGGRKPGRCWSNKSRSSIQSGFLIRGIIVIFVGGCCGKPYLPAQSADKLNGGGSSWDYDDSVVSLRVFFWSSCVGLMVEILLSVVLRSLFNLNKFADIFFYVFPEEESEKGCFRWNPSLRQPSKHLSWCNSSNSATMLKFQHFL